jgi:hypothetical protein
MSATSGCLRIGAQERGPDRIAVRADDTDARPAGPVLDEAQGMHQDRLSRIGKAGDQQMRPLAEARIHAEMQRPTVQQGACGAIADREGLQPQGTVRIRDRKRRWRILPVHEDQALGRSPPRPSARLGTGRDGFDERRRVGGIGQDEGSNPFRIEHLQSLCIDPPGLAALQAQCLDDQIRERSEAADQDREVGRRQSASRLASSACEGLLDERRQRLVRVRQAQHLDQVTPGFSDIDIGKAPAVATPVGKAIGGAAAAGEHQTRPPVRSRCITSRRVISPPAATSISVPCPRARRSATALIQGDSSPQPSPGTSMKWV